MNEIIIASFPLIGVFIGAVSSMFGSYLVNKNKLREIDQKFNQSKEIERHQQYLKRLEQYSKILKVDGEHSIGEFDSSKGIELFNFEAYQENIRPLMFEYLHILDEDIIKLTRKIDKMIAKTESIFPGEFDIHRIDLAGYYFELIKSIEQHVFSSSINISKE